MATGSGNEDSLTFETSVHPPLIDSRKSGRYSRSDLSTDSISDSKSLCPVVRHRLGNADNFQMLRVRRRRLLIYWQDRRSHFFRCVLKGLSRRWPHHPTP